MATTPSRRGRKPKVSGGRKKANVMLPVPVHARFTGESEALDAPLTDLGAYYMILGWNAAHQDRRIPMPRYLEQCVERAQAVEVQEALLAS